MRGYQIPNSDNGRGQGRPRRPDGLVAQEELLRPLQKKRGKQSVFSSRRRHTRCSRDWSSDVCSSDLIRKKTKVMVTDPARKRRTDPGNPDVCPVYDWHKLFSAEEPGRLEWVRQGCTTAGIGCIECKAAMAENLIKWIAPVRERRVKYEKNPKQVLELLDDGSNKARKIA